MNFPSINYEYAFAPNQEKYIGLAYVAVAVGETLINAQAYVW